MANPYNDTGETNELSVDRNIPDKAAVMVVLTDIPEIKEVGQNKTPVAEAQFLIQGGQFDGRKVRKSFWLNPTPKEGKEKSALYWTKVSLAEVNLRLMGAPEVEFVQSKETPASAARRAPFIQKYGQQISGATDAKSLITLACKPLLGKAIPARISVKDDGKFKNTEVGSWITAEQYKKDTTAA